jgi:hypothetical protein
MPPALSDEMKNATILAGARDATLVSRVSKEFRHPTVG